MGSAILTTIIAVEREIQERIVAEERRAADMLKNLRRELEEEIAREGECLASSIQEAVAAARTEAQRRADAIVRSATRRADQLEGLTDETLGRCIMKHLGRISRERANDSKDGQGRNNRPK